MRFLLLFSGLLIAMSSSAQIITPGNGSTWTIDSLISAFPDEINEFMDGDERIIEIVGNVTVDSTDTLILSDFTLRLGDTAYLSTVDAVIKLENLNISGIENDTFPRMRFDLTDVRIDHCVFNKGGGISLVDATCDIDNSDFLETLHLERGVGSAISLFRTKGTIKNSTFSRTESAAILSGVNAAIAVHIDNCRFFQNNTMNKNSPQLNFADSAEGDSIVVSNCEIIGGESLKSGGIGLTSLVERESKIIVEGNLIKNNRYGVTIIGNNVTSSIQNNVIIGNNIEDKPMLGGSGINLYGGETNISYIGGNHIEDNLWGLTIQASNQVEHIAPLPYLSEPDGETLPYPTTQNAFIDNGNSGAVFALYNQNKETIYARQNYWNTTDSVEIEESIYHKVDDAELGLVLYDDFLLRHPDSTSVAVINADYGKIMQVYPNPIMSGSELQLPSDIGAGILRIYNNRGNVVKAEVLDTTTSMVTVDFMPGEYHLLFINKTGDKYRSRIIVIN